MNGWVPVFRYPQLQGDRLWWETRILGDLVATKRQAISEGFKAQGSDDFNVVEVVRGDVVRVWWMDTDLREDDDVCDRYTLELRQAGVLR